MNHRIHGLLALACILSACELFEQPEGQFHARFDDAGGLREGAQVYVAGVRVGRVGAVRLDGDKARVDFTLDTAAEVAVHEDACVSVGWYGGGEPHLGLKPGKANQPALADGSEIQCVRNAGDRAETILDRASELLEEVAKGKGTVGRLIHDEALADKVERYFESRPREMPAPAASSAAKPATSASPPAGAPPALDDRR